MKSILPILVFIAIFLAIDLYAFKSFKVVSEDWTNTVLRNTALIGYIISSLATYGLIIYALSQFSRDASNPMNSYLFSMAFGVVVLMFLPKLVVAVFHLFDDIVNLLKWLSSFFVQKPAVETLDGDRISRWKFISQLGWILAAIPFAGILYGMIQGRYAFRVITKTLNFANLPASANGLRIVHISDIHIGSFHKDGKEVKAGIKMVNDLQPDIIFFTGDLVNNFATETDGWDDILAALKAKYGKYSILGNHDYGDYAEWQNASAKNENLDRLKAYHSKIGFKLLLNEWTPFTTAAGETFEIIGVENWGAGGFTKYGDLDKAMEGTNSKNFQVLLSHDPSHWDAKVIGKTEIDLTLSGHTHGMQFGIEIPGLIKWSPVKYRYPRWGGLYSEASQMIYVNRGFGYIGFPGRVGMPPEITLLELKKG
ncbi:metallophosphoesterase [Cryomorpha ignava]|uniref:Metallophosphoesterase n=1 Tax=Cryomorpha ignava TaxID=101383 RepID=A0A7K3WW13_9FLAO|nr:metallophosphoesterase [Cryomorpha ignava]NEN25823.1 metallophosphoesterase [Cryomorpha ignava]